MEQEDRFIDEEGPLDEDARFQPHPWEKGQCKECNVWLSQAEENGIKFSYCGNYEDCSLGTNRD